jgi:NAD(P)-dependent dehydrogenase (short-subunit alcohol dehydrogenase family)
MAVPYKETPDGFESHFQVNYLSHFLLTNLLLPQMLNTSKETGIRGRIVNVSAALQAYGTIDFDNLQLK